VSHNRCATTVAPVDHTDHGVVEVFAQAFFEKACGKAFRRGGLQSKAYLKKGCNTELK